MTITGYTRKEMFGYAMRSWQKLGFAALGLRMVDDITTAYGSCTREAVSERHDSTEPDRPG